MCINKEIKEFRKIERDIISISSLNGERFIVFDERTVKQYFPKIKEKVDKNGRYETNCGIIIKLTSLNDYSFRYFRK